LELLELWVIALHFFKELLDFFDLELNPKFYEVFPVIFPQRDVRLGQFRTVYGLLS